MLRRLVLVIRPAICSCWYGARNAIIPIFVRSETARTAARMRVEFMDISVICRFLSGAEKDRAILSKTEKSVGLQRIRPEQRMA